MISVRTAKAEDFYKISKIIEKLAYLKKDKIQTTPEQLIKDAGLKSKTDSKLFECVVADFEDNLIGYATFYYAFTRYLVY